MDDNELTALPEDFNKLVQLQELSLAGNKLTTKTLPKEFHKLVQLETLNLSNNKISELPDKLDKFINLQELDLSNNELIAFPEELCGFPNLRELNLKGNKFITPPQRIANQGLGVIRRWYDQRHEQGTIWRFESKVLVFGSPETGKTTLCKKIQDIHYAVPSSESRTVGVDITHWPVTVGHQGSSAVAYAHLFDFGGQRIQHMGHQFFLSPKAFHILLLNNKTRAEELGFWLESIQYSEHNPNILVVYNQFNGNMGPLTASVLASIKHLPTIVLSVDLSTSDLTVLTGNIESIKQYIRKHILAHSEEVLVFWEDIKQTLDKLTDNYISIDNYRSICRKHKLVDTVHQNDLLKDLTQTGYALHFEHVDANTIYLNPNWLIKALYTLYDPKNALICEAYFEREALMKAWSEADADHPAYSEKERNDLFNLLLRGGFNVCYQLSDTQSRYLVPQYLSDCLDSKMLVPWHRFERQHSARSTEVVYVAYEFLPLGFMGQLIVELSPLIFLNGSTPVHWQKGMLLSKRNAMALIEERESCVYGKHMAIKIIGPARDSGFLRRHLQTGIERLLEKLSYPYETDWFMPCLGCVQNTVKGHRFTLNDRSTECPVCGKDRQSSRLETDAVTIHNTVNGNLVICEVVQHSSIKKGDSVKGDKIQGDCIEGDKLEGDKVSGDKTIGDNIKIIGDSSVVNYRSNTKSVIQSVEPYGAPDMNQFIAAAVELKELLDEVLLDEVLKDNKDNSEALSDHIRQISSPVAALLNECEKSTPNALFVVGQSEILIKAAKKIGKVAPPIIDMATKLVSLAQKLFASD